MPVQVEEDANGRAHIDSAFRSITVNVIVEEPRSLMIDIHRPASLVFAYEDQKKKMTIESVNLYIRWESNRESTRNSKPMDSTLTKMVELCNPKSI